MLVRLVDQTAASRALHLVVVPPVCRCPFLAGTQEAVLQEGQAELRAVNDHQQRQVGLLTAPGHLPPALSHALLVPTWRSTLVRPQLPLLLLSRSFLNTSLSGQLGRWSQLQGCGLVTVIACHEAPVACTASHVLTADPLIEELTAFWGAVLLCCMYFGSLQSIMLCRTVLQPLFLHMHYLEQISRSMDINGRPIGLHIFSIAAVLDI